MSLHDPHHYVRRVVLPSGKTIEVVYFEDQTAPDSAPVAAAPAPSHDESIHDLHLCGGCASTLGFEMSDGLHRLVVSCGGARNGGALLPAQLAGALRTTAAHSTLIVADANSTAVHADGSLGRGVTEVEVDRQELESGSRLEASHDGYARRYGLLHRRQLALSVDGRQLVGEDMLLPAGRRKRAAPFAIRFHLAPDVEVTLTADNQGALLRIDGGPLWQFRCKGGALGVEESLWVDGAGRPRETQQLVVSAQSPAGGASVSWLFKRAG